MSGTCLSIMVAEGTFELVGVNKFMILTVRMQIRLCGCLHIIILLS
jgi:hypothetical protein